MTNPNLSQLVAECWEEMLRESENPFRDSHLFYALGGRKPPPYREWLTRQQINYHGDPIPRIAVVRRNLRRLGNIRLDPRRLV